MKIWDILTDHCGAQSPHTYSQFIHWALTHGPYSTEFRFIGALGFGGKVWLDDPPYNPRWRVSCYQEDETPARRDMIASANRALAQLLKELEAKP